MELIRWTVVEAKGRFSALIERALRDGPQAVTRNGADVVVVVAARDWRSGSARRTPLDVLMKTDLRFGLQDKDIAKTFPRLGLGGG
jgi:prevent-host-death family protein